MKSKITIKGPLALYVSYYVLLTLAVALIALSFRVDRESALFSELLATGAIGAMVALSMILYSTQIERKMHADIWRKDAEQYYNDEGLFEYTHNGFSVITKEGRSLNIPWHDIIKIDSREEKVNNYLKLSYIDIYFSDRDLLTVDSSMAGFSLFETRLKGNMRYLWKEKKYSEETQPAQKKTAELS